MGNTTPKKVRTRSEIRSLQHQFSRAELEKIAEDASQKASAVSKTKDELDSIRKRLKADIDNGEVEVSRLLSLYRTKYEMRDIECEVHLDTPEPGRATVFRMDTNAIVEVRDMNAKERQFLLDEENREKKGKVTAIN